VSAVLAARRLTPHRRAEYDEDRLLDETLRRMPTDLSHTLERLYRQRVSAPDRTEMQAVWRVLVRDFFQSRIRPDRVVVDIGAGLCQFINEVRAANASPWTRTPRSFASRVRA
jgi:hypothetical protein